MGGGDLGGDRVIRLARWAGAALVGGILWLPLGPSVAPDPPSTLPSTSTMPTSMPTTTTLPGLTIGFGGDTSFTHDLADRDPLGEVAELFASQHLTLVNLETVVAEEGVGTPSPKEYTFRSPPESAVLLSEAGVDGVSLANNHTFDLGEAGLARTLELLDGQGVGRTGAGRDAAEAYSPLLFEAAGRTVAVLGFSRVLPDIGWAAGPGRAGVASAYEVTLELTVQAVAEAAGRADLVVVMVHWGVEKEPCPRPYQRALAERWGEAGADAVVGSHPHVLQGIERVGGAWVAYSTGNLAFPSAQGASARAAVVELVLDRNVELRVRPITIVQGRPAPAAGDPAAEIRSFLSEHGWEVRPDGRVVSVEGGRCR
jgi:poly-gamma-glutamate capsule biosynthesis protein CapA/YwtB (metallophosphatase superfamily)